MIHIYYYMDSLKLLCTFSHKKNLEYTIQKIEDDLLDIQKIFIFHNVENPSEKYLTFNINTNKNPVYNNYITIHRKKDTNTLYTVNALNIIIRNLNNGILDIKYIINWTLYNNMLLLVKHEDVNRISLELEDIIEY